MANITTSITITQNTPAGLFPTNGSVTASKIEQINSDADFKTTILNPGETDYLLEPTVSADPSNTVYLYVQSLSTNTGDTSISYTISGGSSTTIATLRSGEFMWLPLRVNTPQISVSATNLGGSNSTIYTFWGGRG